MLSFCNTKVLPLLGGARQQRVVGDVAPVIGHAQHDQGLADQSDRRAARLGQPQGVILQGTYLQARSRLESEGCSWANVRDPAMVEVLACKALG